MKRLAAAILLAFSLAASAAIEVHQFKDANEEARYNQLTTELRCLVCQNEDLADSNADLAKDLRNKVFEMLQNGQTNKEIIDYMVKRYGDFVLYKPPLQSNTYALWFGPAILLVLGIFLLLRFVRRRGAAAETAAPLSEAEHVRARQLLDDSKEQTRS
jgi:cytochrome c-type biogenesis protein CcmH